VTLHAEANLESGKRMTHKLGSGGPSVMFHLPLVLLVTVLVFPFVHLAGGRAMAPDGDYRSVSTMPLRTPVPNSVYPYREQRIGVVAFSTSGLDIASLHAGFLKLEDRGLAARERELGFDSVTVLLVGRGWCVPTDPVDWQSCRTDIAQLVAANPGHSWFIGNEPENPCRPGGMHPSEYARTYHIVYHFIKEQDPAAKVGIAGALEEEAKAADIL